MNSLFNMVDDNGFSQWWDSFGNLVPPPEVNGLTSKGIAHIFWNAGFEHSRKPDCDRCDRKDRGCNCKIFCSAFIPKGD